MKLTVPSGFVPAPKPVVTFEDFRCEHGTVENRRLVKSNGVTVVTRQCLRCGSNLREVPKGGIAVHELKEFDRTIADRFSAERSRQYEQKRTQEQEEWQRWYDTYLLSPRWHRLREKVLIRDGYKCQGCLTNRATMVHHLTYARVGNELMFDLVSICDDCHGVCHPGKF